MFTVFYRQKIVEDQNKFLSEILAKNLTMSKTSFHKICVATKIYARRVKKVSAGNF
jgi:hypothetical protein